MNCQQCQKEVFLPFKCPYCGGSFCAEHRLPENHNCPRMEQARTPRQDLQPVAVQQQKSHEFTVTYGPIQRPKGRIYFSPKELKHLSVAALLVVAIGLSPALYYQYLKLDSLALLAAILTVSFFIHEIAHKITAQRDGFWAEFRLTLIGAALTLISVVSPLFKIISPGAVMIAGAADARTMGKVSIAGPATNLTLATVFLAAASLVSPQYALILLLGAFFNAWIALFNLIPFGILDGFKIFSWDKKVWALAFAASLVLTIVTYMFISSQSI